MVATTCLPSGFPRKSEIGDRKVARLAMVYARVHLRIPRPLGESSHLASPWPRVLIAFEAARPRSARYSREKKAAAGELLSSSSLSGPSDCAGWRRKVKTRRERSPVEGMMKVPLRSFCGPPDAVAYVSALKYHIKGEVAMGAHTSFRRPSWWPLASRRCRARAHLKQ